MNNVKKNLINKIIKEVKKENDYRKEVGQEMIDVCDIIAPIDQQIHKYKNFIKDLESHEWELSAYESDTTGGYTKGKINVYLEPMSLNKIYYSFNFYLHHKSLNYCGCKPNDNGYNEKYKCCGENCDWEIPTFTLEKKCILGIEEFQGLQKDYWEYKDNFNNNNGNDKDKQEEINILEKQLNEIKEKLEKIMK